MPSIINNKISLSMYKNENAYSYRDNNGKETSDLMPVIIGQGTVTTLDTDIDGPNSVVTIRPATGFTRVECTTSNERGMHCTGKK